MSFPEDQPTLPHFPDDETREFGAPPANPRASRPVVAGIMVAILSALLGAAIAHLAWSGNSTLSPGASGTFAPFSPGTGAANNGGVSSSATGGSVSSIADKVDPGLVDINTTLASGEGQAAGTGMVVTSGGEVITNNHVISDATAITATDLGDNRTYTARVIGYDQSQDVAVIQLIGASGLRTVSTGNSNNVHVGQSIITIGNAGGVGGTPSAVSGSVIAVGQSITASDDVDETSEHLTGLIEIDGGLEPGDSGGPLTGDSGTVFGMDTAASSNGSFSFQSSNDEGFAIPINEVLAIAHQIEAGDNANSLLHLGPTPLIGVEVCSDPQVCEQNGYGSFNTNNNSQTGAYVGGAVNGSSAASAGIVAGDWITSLAGRTVTSPQSLVTIKNRFKPGDVVKITWVDGNGGDHTASITLSSGPPD
jgi:S1-C subfamily serine protease